VQGVFLFNCVTMRKSILSIIAFFSLCGFAQTDTSEVTDILTKLKKLEEIATKDSSINPLKAITDSTYGKKVVGAPPKAEQQSATKVVKPIENPPIGNESRIGGRDTAVYT
jgi:hypothetical protein